MTGTRSQPQANYRPSDSGFGRMLALSLGLHLAFAFFFALGFLPSSSRNLRPIYSVDLVNLPVRDPQAGRPDARPEPPKKAEAAAPAPAIQPQPPKTPPVVVKAEPAKTVAKEPAKPEPKITAEDEKAFAEKIRRLQARKEEADFNDMMKNLAARVNQQKTAAPVEAPVGEQTGKGNDKGVFFEGWVGTKLKEQWAYSTSLAGQRPGLETKLFLDFDANGRLADYKIEKSSGNELFDRSIINAILKLFKEQNLPQPPKEPIRLHVTFNLKDLQK